MIWLLLALLAGAALGLLAGGNIRNLAHVRLRGESWLWLLFVLQGVARSRWPFGALFPASWATPVWLAASVALIVVLALNSEFRGLTVLAVGIGLNVLVVALNLGMPVPFGNGGELPPMYVPGSSSTLLPGLGDVLRLPDLGGYIAASLGDLVMWLGAGWTMFEMVRRQTPVA